MSNKFTLIFLCLFILWAAPSCTILRYQNEAIATAFKQEKEKILAKKKAKADYERHCEELIKQGRLEKGFTKKQVTRAIGKPDRKDNASLLYVPGQLSIWEYKDAGEYIFFVNGKFDGRRNRQYFQVKR